MRYKVNKANLNVQSPVEHVGCTYRVSRQAFVLIMCTGRFLPQSFQNSTRGLKAKIQHATLRTLSKAHVRKMPRKRFQNFQPIPTYRRASPQDLEAKGEVPLRLTLTLRRAAISEPHSVSKVAASATTSTGTAAYVFKMLCLCELSSRTTLSTSACSCPGVLQRRLEHSG